MAVIHAAAPNIAQELCEYFSHTWFEEQVLVGETGPVIGTHTGPGAVGVAWVNGKF